MRRQIKAVRKKESIPLAKAILFLFSGIRLRIIKLTVW
jgi:hypothetical protein